MLSFCLILLGGTLPVDGVDSPSIDSIDWNARTVEHLFDRAAFGARSDEIAAGLELGPRALVDRLFATDRPWKRIEPELFRWEDVGFDHRQLPLKRSRFHALSAGEQVRACKAHRLLDREQFRALEAQWLDSCIDNGAPIRDRMLLFWHQHFTTSIDVNKRKFEIMNQFQWMRSVALSSFAEILHGIVRDPAMLQYYDNTGNYKEHPNENFARELMELYSLGEGHYTEHDVREAARALTGWAATSEGTFTILEDRHDHGLKTILGHTGDFDADQLVELLLEQPACSRYLAARLLRYFEGAAPEDARLERYAAFLREHSWSIEAFLRELFLDPRFYRAELVGAKVQGPIEFMVSTCHRLDFVPPIEFLHEATDAMGQSLYSPPTVKGWPEGLAWMAGDALLRRGNCMAILCGTLEPRERLEAGLTPQCAIEAHAQDDGLDGRAMSERSVVGSRLEYPRLADYIAGRWWKPSERWLERLKSAGADSDRALVDEVLESWLASAPSDELRELVLQAVSRERAEARLGHDSWLEHPREFDACLRRLAKLVFSLPEAQLS